MPHPNLHSMLPQAEQRNKELQALGVGVKVVAVGKKAQVYFKRRKDRFEIVGEWHPYRTTGCVKLSIKILINIFPHSLHDSFCMPVLHALWLPNKSKVPVSALRQRALSLTSAN